MVECIPLAYKSASVQLVPLDGYSIVHNLYSTEPGKGHATKLMESVAKYADKLETRLILEARQYGNPNGLSTEQLKSFYERFGFVVLAKVDNAYVMERKPSQELQGL